MKTEKEESKFLLFRIARCAGKCAGIYLGRLRLAAMISAIVKSSG